MLCARTRSVAARLEIAGGACTRGWHPVTAEEAKGALFDGGCGALE